MARQLLNYHAELAGTSSERTARLLSIREAMIADNMAYMISRECGRRKVFAFAHNSHLQRGKTQWQLGPDLLTWWPVGSHLNALFGPCYAVIDSAFGVSDANGIGRPEAGTLEARLTAAQGPVRFILTHNGRGLPAAEIAALPIHSGSVTNSTYLTPLNPQSFTDFDWLVVLDSTAYSRGGPPLEPWDAEPE